jgi:hypothetical protein
MYGYRENTMTEVNLETPTDEVKSISLFTLVNGDYVEFMVKFQKTLNKFPDVIIALGNMATTFDDLVVNLQDSLVAERGSALTMTLADSDKCRDDIHRGLCHYVEAYRWHKDGGKADAANHLLRVVKQYGTSGLRKSGYNVETAMMRSLVVDLKSEKNIDFTTQIGLTEWIDDLAVANEAFSALMEDRQDEVAVSLDYTTRDVRKVLTPHFRKMVKVIEANAIIGTNSDYQEIINQLNSEIELTA